MQHDTTSTDSLVEPTDVEASDALTVNLDGAGDVVFVCEHATNFIPDAFKNLGLAQDVLDAHVAWDIGALAVAKHLSSIFNAPLIAPSVSRLLYDCNRSPDEPTAIPEQSEIHAIPGNAGLSPAQRQERVERFYEPFRKALTDVLDARLSQGQATVLVTVHSFTPVYHGRRREMDIGILHDQDSLLADALLDIFSTHTELQVRRNEPYGPSDGVTHTLAEHALPRALPNAMIEIHNDLIVSEAGQRDMARQLGHVLRAALERLNTPPTRKVSS